MGNTNVVTPLVYPSQNDLHGTGPTGDGNTVLEKYNRELFKAVTAIGYVLSGGLLPTTAADRNLIVPAGAASMSGYYVTWAQTTVALPASATSHVFVKLIFSGGLISNVQIEDNTSGTHPADSIKLGTVVTSATAITSSTDQRLLDGNQRIRRTVFTATTTWIVPANVTRARARMWGAGGGGGGGGGGSGLPGEIGGNGAPGQHGGYVEAVLSLTPGQTVTITLAAGGGGGSGGGISGNGGSGSQPGDSTLVGTGFSFTAQGGVGGLGGAGCPNGGPLPGDRPHLYQPSGASATTGTADLLLFGGGMSGGAHGPGQQNSGIAGAAGQNAVCLFDY